MRYVFAVLIGIHIAPAHAEEIPDAFRRLCASTSQSTCWLKGGNKICSKMGRNCSYVQPDDPVHVLSRTGDWLHVETSRGSGYVKMDALVTAEP